MCKSSTSIRSLGYRHNYKHIPVKFSEVPLRGAGRALPFFFLYASGTTYMVHEDQVSSTRQWMVYSARSWNNQESVTNLAFGDGLTSKGVAIMPWPYTYP